MAGLRSATVRAVLILMCASAARAGTITEIYNLNLPAPESPVQDLNGLSVRAIFRLDSDMRTQLVIEVTNTSTGIPAGFTNATQLVTAISFDFGASGDNEFDPRIIAGAVVIGPDSESINFDQIIMQLGPGADVSGEWGYSNIGIFGLHQNFVTATRAHSTAFGGVNLDGPPNLSGPQGGLATDPSIVPPGGLGFVSDTVVIKVELDAPLYDLKFLNENGVRAAFGSDAAFVLPEPATLWLLAPCALAARRRRRSP